jgi:hypothetical protein
MRVNPNDISIGNFRTEALGFSTLSSIANS